AAFFGAMLLVVTGPTDFGIARDRIASIIARQLGPGYTVEIRRAVLDVDPVLGLVVRADDLDVRDSSNVVVAHVPATRFAIDAYGLLAFRAEVKQVELTNPEFAFVRDGGALYLGNANTAHPQSGPVEATVPLSEA